MPTIFHAVRNNARSQLVSDITSTATTIYLKAGEGARFPSTFPFDITVEDEIMEVTNRVNDTLTVTRAHQSTINTAHKAGTAVMLNITAISISELQSAINTLEGRLNYGTYTGDGTVNRAIPHGLGSVPSLVVIQYKSSTVWYLYFINNASSRIIYMAFDSTFQSSAPLATTTPNSTNFYVGNSSDYAKSANASGVGYQWYALA